uniref:Uncharacterized protein n=1 Tax=Romanomermis culicivorax TaxID=13658 RepID=A0A915KLL9_ROMCU
MIPVHIGAMNASLAICQYYCDYFHRSYLETRPPIFPNQNGSSSLDWDAMTSWRPELPKGSGQPQPPIGMDSYASVLQYISAKG